MKEMIVMKKSYETLNSMLERSMALQTSLVLFEWDNETLAPEEAGSYTNRVIGVLSEEYYRIMTGDEMGKAIEACEKDDDLSDVEQAIKSGERSKRRFSLHSITGI
jgi:carboxypeptidase Taq